MPASGGAHYAIRNPARPGERLAEFADSTRADVTAAVEPRPRPRRAWADTPGPQRGAILFRFAELLEASKDELARIITLEQGKALGEAVGEVGRAAAEARFMAGEASRPAGHDFPSERPGFSCSTVTEPLGVIAAICPWNFPVVTPVRKIAPAMAFGNTVVFKPASLTPWSAVYLVQLLERAGLPPGVVNLITGSGAVVGEALIQRRPRARHHVHGIDQGRDPHLRSGGPPAGARAARARAARTRPWSSTATTSTARRVRSSRPRSFAAVSAARRISRVIVLDAQADALVERILTQVGRIKVGNGLEPGTTMGPLVSRASCDGRRIRAAGRGFGLRGCSPAASRSTTTRSRTATTTRRRCSTACRADSPLALRRDLRSGAADPAGRAISTRRSRSPTARATGWRRRCSRRATATWTSSRGAWRPA